MRKKGRGSTQDRVVIAGDFIYALQIAPANCDEGPAGGQRDSG